MDAEEALSLVRRFSDDEWLQTSVSQVTVRLLPCGNSRNLHLVARTTPSVKEASSLLIRRASAYFASTGEPHVLSTEEELLLHHTLSRSGLSARLVGIGKEVQVEEFLDRAHNLTPAEFEDPEIRDQLASALARFHQLDLPFDRTKGPRFDQLMASFFRGVDRAATVEKITSISGDEDCARQLFQTDWAAELESLREMMAKVGGKMVLTHGDTNFNNILVCEESGGGKRVLLVDYETAKHGFRGNDLGNLFVNKVLKWDASSDRRSGYPYPSYEERSAFCEAYLRTLGADVEPEVDTLEHLLLEGEIGCLWYCCFVLYFVLKHLQRFTSYNPAGVLSVLRTIVELHRERKALLLQQHPALL